MENSEFICESHLKSQHGWTGTLIRDHLGYPDETIPNPHCPSGNRQIKLYSKKRIELIEEDTDFQKDISKARKRSEAHRKDAKESWL